MRALGPPLDSVFRLAAQAGAFAEVARGVPATVRLEFLKGAVDSSMVVLTRTRRTAITLDSPAERIRGPNPKPPKPWPEGLVYAVVRLRFMVLESGRADSSTVEVLSWSDEALLAEARRVVLATEFRPAMAAGCPMPQLVEWNVRFSR